MPQLVREQFASFERATFYFIYVIPAKAGIQNAGVVMNAFSFAPEYRGLIKCDVREAPMRQMRHGNPVPVFVPKNSEVALAFQYAH